MEQLVVSLETAKELRAAGFPQETYFIHAHYQWTAQKGTPKAYVQNHWAVRQRTNTNSQDPLSFAAPTAQEIADQLRGKGLGWIMESVLDRHKTTLQGIDTVISSELVPKMAESLAEVYLKVYPPVEDSKS